MFIWDDEGCGFCRVRGFGRAALALGARVAYNGREASARGARRTKGATLSKRAAAIAISATCALLACALAGCGPVAEEPQLPNPDAGSASSASPSGGYALTDEADLESLAVGESAVWRDYEVAVRSVERADGLLNVGIEVTAHSRAQELSADCLLSFGMPPVSSTFDGGVITVAAGETAQGTLAFDDRYVSQRLFWNDEATEAFWLLDQEAATPQADAAAQKEQPAEGAGSADADPEGDAQARAVAALEAELPSLFENNTYFTFQSVDAQTAAVAPREEGGYSYANTVSILDAEGNPTTANVELICEPDGNCTSMTLDGVLLF